MDGFLNINKPAGMTSHDVVAKVRRIAGRGVKVGHAGTLDPAATGVLPLALGRATRLLEYLTDSRKRYRGLVQLGVITTTDDAEGEALEQRPVPTLTTDEIEVALARFRGDIQQVPPMYSALHHEGKRLYELARAGETVERPARPVTIYALELTNYDPATALVRLDIECSKGTYIRTLAHDVGEILGYGGHLAALERTAVGRFTIEQATTLGELVDGDRQIGDVLLPMELAVDDWPMLTLTSEQNRLVRNGQTLTLDHSEQRLRAHDTNGLLVALLQRDGEQWKPLKVLG